MQHRQGRYERHWRDGDYRQGSGGSTIQPRSPLPAKERLDRNRSPNHSDRRDRTTLNSEEPRRLDRNRVSKSEVVDQDDQAYESFVKLGQEQAREKERQRQRSKEEKKTKSSKIRDSSPEDVLEQLHKKPSSSKKVENGSDTRVNGSREDKVSSTWNGPDADRNYGSSSRGADKYRHNDGYGQYDTDRDTVPRSRNDEGSDCRGEYSRDWRSDRPRSHREGSSRSRQDYEYQMDQYKPRREDDIDNEYHYGREMGDDERRYRHSEDRGHSRLDPRSNGYSNDRDRKPGPSYDHRRKQSHSQHYSQSDTSNTRRHSRSSYPDSDKHQHDLHEQTSADSKARSHTESPSLGRDELPHEEAMKEALELPPAPPIESRPTTPPPPPTPPVVYSFNPVKLPHQLLEPGNEALMPLRKVDGKKLMPFKLPSKQDIEKESVESPEKEDSKCVDPRKKGRLRPVREKLRALRYKWDIHSVKQPSCVILVRGASPLMTKKILSHHFRSFGKIAEMDQKNDQLGQSLGIFSIRYVQDYTDDRNLKEGVVSGITNQRGDLVAIAAVKGSQGKIVPNEDVTVSLDENEKTNFEKTFNVEMAKRVALKVKRSDIPAVAPDAKLSASASTTEVRMPPPVIPTGPRYDVKLPYNGSLPAHVVVQPAPPFVAPRIGKWNHLMQQRPRYPYAPVNGHFQAQPRYHSNQSSPSKTRPKRDAKTSWSEQELFADSKLLILRELGDSFIRDLKTRTINAFLKDFMKADSVGGQALRAPAKVVEEVENSESEAEIRKPKGRRRKMMEDERERVGATPESTENSEKSPSDIEGDVIAADLRGRDVEKQESKKSRKMKKTKMALAVDVVDEIRLEDDDGTTTAPTALRIKAKKAAIKKIREPSPLVDPIALGLAEDEEDHYYLKVVLEKVKSGKSVAEVQAEEVEAIKIAADLDSEVGVNGLPRHSSGSARTEGMYKIPPAEKAVHMPDRNRAAVDPSHAVGFASARDNRADSRRFVQGIEQHKKETATDTDILKFNQLRSRKKQLKFSKSPIHDWGLYAVELIPAGDMVIEYVGEIVRQQVADQREKMYERQGNFSTYLFRVDDDVVVDATKKGNIARLMNHCCTPNCNAKILTLNGEKRIVLFAQKPILPGQELTYDYKFQATGDEEDAIACLCGSSGCRRFL